MTKAEARKFYLDKRHALSDADRRELNQKIFKNFVESGYLDTSDVIHIFLSMERTKEPDTWQFLELNKKFVVPRIKADGTLEHFYYDGPDQLAENKYGILEPKGGVPCIVNNIDFVFVPLAAFDVKGNRVGYGKGFYDRFLKDCRIDCVKAGLSFFEASEEEFSDVEPHDIPLDICITPQALRDLSNGTRRVPR